MRDGPVAIGICLEEYSYPYPVQFFPVTSDLQQLKMAYMDIAPNAERNGRTVVLFHRKAFGCYYFQNAIEALTGAGYRVVAPDQLGWGKSAKPDIHYSFQLTGDPRRSPAVPCGCHRRQQCQQTRPPSQPAGANRAAAQRGGRGWRRFGGACASKRHYSSFTCAASRRDADFPEFRRAIRP
jgi:hypothetical protein